MLGQGHCQRGMYVDQIENKNNCDEWFFYLKKDKNKSWFQLFMQNEKMMCVKILCKLWTYVK